jgi:hypothetical protein
VETESPFNINSVICFITKIPFSLLLPSHQDCVSTHPAPIELFKGVFTLFPLLAPDAGAPDYLVLEEALSQGAVDVTEVSQGGSVPDLKLINKSANKLLVVDGEELIGAKQNLIVNATFLISGNTEVIIPVSCVEQGRWSYRSHKFASGEKVMPPSMRLKNQRAVAMNLKEGSGYRSDQGMIWDELVLKSDRMAVHSATGAMADLFEGQRDRHG